MISYLQVSEYVNQSDVGYEINRLIRDIGVELIESKYFEARSEPAESKLLIKPK